MSGWCRRRKKTDGSSSLLKASVDSERWQKNQKWVGASLEKRRREIREPKKDESENCWRQLRRRWTGRGCRERRSSFLYTIPPTWWAGVSQPSDFLQGLVILPHCQSLETLPSGLVQATWQTPFRLQGQRLGFHQTANPPSPRASQECLGDSSNEPRKSRDSRHGEGQGG